MGVCNWESVIVVSAVSRNMVEMRMHAQGKNRRYLCNGSSDPLHVCF